jgi:hypothetical protein
MACRQETNWTRRLSKKGPPLTKSASVIGFVTGCEAGFSRLCLPSTVIGG